MQRRRGPRRARRSQRETAQLVRASDRSSVSRFVVAQESARSFRYAWQANTATSTIISSSTGYFSFRGNNIFNPNATILGENFPVGVPAMANLYQFYYVRGATLKVTVTTIGVIAESSARFLIWSSAYGAGLPVGAVSVDDFDGQANATNAALVGPVSGTTIRSLTQARRTNEMLSRVESGVHCAPEASGSLTSASVQPTTVWFFNVIFSNNDPTAIILPNMLFHFELTFDTILFSPVAFPIGVDLVTIPSNAVEAKE